MYIAFHITLQTPPANLTYALQKGSGSSPDVVQIQRSTGGDLYFQMDIEIKGAQQTNPLPDFRGPFVQGPVASRFIYINIGTYAGSSHLSSGRIKVPLTGMGWDLIANAKNGLQTTIPGTGKNGGPAYATVKPFDGWQPTV